MAAGSTEAVAEVVRRAAAAQQRGARVF